MTEAAIKTDVVERLRARTCAVLPPNWKEGRACPCGADANRQRCLFERGPDCLRHDPNNYDPSPFVETPDDLCIEAADEIARLRGRATDMKTLLTRLLRLAQGPQYLLNEERVIASLGTGVFADAKALLSAMEREENPE